ncbi:MAG: glucose-6-phosphate isomerase, partial [Quisquiliibacterium sp.]
KTAALGWLWRINSYDQWGVDLGKELAQRIEASLLDETAAEQNLDPSTAALLRRVRKLLASR